MAETTYNDALNLIGEVKPKEPVRPGTFGAFKAVLSGEPERIEGTRQREARELSQERKFVAENREAGIPLETEEGLGAGVRAKMSFERDPKKKADWLSQQEGIESARVGSDGDTVIARVKTDDGSFRDVLLDERRMTMRDFADMTGDLPGIATQALIGFFMGGASIPAQAALTAGGGAIAGAAQDVITRKAAGTDVDAGEIAKARGTQAAFDVALPMMAGGAKRVAESAVGPFSKSVGPLEREAREAAERLKVPLKASQLTGNKAIARVERFTENLPFGTPLVEQTKRQDEAIDRVRKFLLEGDTENIPSNQEISERVSGTLALEKEAGERQIQSKRMQAESQSQTNIESLLEQNLPGTSVTPSQAGAGIRSRVTQMRDQFKNTANDLYGKVYSSPGASEEFISGAPIISLVNEIKDSSSEATQRLLPEISRIFKVGSAFEKTEKLPPILDKFGKVIGPTEIVIPQKMTLRQAVELRSVIGDMMSRPEALPGIPEGYLKRLYGAAAEAIDQGVKSAPNPEIGTRLAEAQKFYKDNFWKFEQPGIADLFLETAPGKGFSVGDSQIARRLTQGGGNVDALRTMKEMLGGNSPEYKRLLRSSLNEMMADASFGEKYVDAGQFLSRLKGMSPEFRKDAIGPIEKELVGESKLLELLQGRKIEPVEMERILNARPGKVASTIREVAEEQDLLDRQYKSTLMKQLTDGRLSPAQFNADDFVSRFVDNSSAQDLKQVMTQLRVLDPEIPTMIRRRSMADLLDKIKGDVTPDDAFSDTFSNFDFKKLNAALSGPSGEKYRTLLGQDAIDTLEDLATVEASRAKSKQMASQAGQLVYSNILAALMDFKLSEVPRIAKNRILASMLSTPGIKAWLTSQAKIPATPKIRYAVMTSPPVIRSILNEFSNEPDLAGQVIDAIKGSPDAEESRPPTAMDLIEARPNTPSPAATP